MDRSTRQRFAVASLVGTCEGLVESGKLPDPLERSFRLLIAETLSAFNMPIREDLDEHFRPAGLNRIQGILG